MKFTPKSLKDEISCILAEFSITLGSPIEVKDKDYARRYNRILEKYVKRILKAVDRKKKEA